MTNTYPDKKVALVIGWGSVKCAAVLGLLRVLQREKIGIDLVVGSGGGSIYASLIALGYDSERIIEMTRQLWTAEVTARTNRMAIFQILLPRFFKVREYFNLRDDRLVNERLQTAMGGHSFADTQIPLFINATEYKTGAQVILQEGSLFEAVRASVALPLIFPPVEQDDKLLSDGYLSDPMPVGIAIREGAEIILAMGFQSNLNAPVRSLAGYLFHLSGLMSNNLLNASYSFYNLAHHSEVIPIVPDFGEDVHLFDTHKIPEIIRSGEVEAEKVVPVLKQLLLGDQV